MGIEETCLNRFLGKCVGCDRDYDVNHHPNNYDCKDYKEFHLDIYEVYDEDTIRKIDKENK